MASILVALIIASENCFIQLKKTIKYLFLLNLLIVFSVIHLKVFMLKEEPNNPP